MDPSTPKKMEQVEMDYDSSVHDAHFYEFGGDVYRPICKVYNSEILNVFITNDLLSDIRPTVTDGNFDFVNFTKHFEKWPPKTGGLLREMPQA